MRRTIAAVLLALAASAPARSEPFDYYLLALSWSPSWCAAEGDPGADQCRPERDLGFVVHGLWPQHAEGWPEFCETGARDPSRRETAAMADVMGSGGLAWAQWKKHGRCSGLDPEDYFDALRRSFAELRLPTPAERTDARAVTAAFRRLNPAIPAEGIVVTCRDGLLREVRICLTKGLEPRACGADVRAGACRPDRPLAAPDAP